MAYEMPGLTDGIRLATADLSTKQFFAVKLDANGKVVIVAAATDQPFGILQNTPKAGEVAVTMKTGISKAVAGATITVGSNLTVDAQGRVVSATIGTDTTKYVIGRALLPASAVGDLISIELNAQTPGRAA